MKMKLFCDSSTNDIQRDINVFLADNPYINISFIEQSMFGEHEGFNIGMMLITVWYVEHYEN